MKPEQINILGKVYKIEYVNNPSDVDIFKRDSLFGQVDFWTNTIRVYDNNREPTEVFHTILHEMFHVICVELKLRNITKSDSYEDTVDLLSLALADILLRNEWLK